MRIQIHARHEPHSRWYLPSTLVRRLADTPPHRPCLPGFAYPQVVYSNLFTWRRPVTSPHLLGFSHELIEAANAANSARTGHLQCGANRHETLIQPEVGLGVGTERGQGRKRALDREQPRRERVGGGRGR